MNDFRNKIVSQIPLTEIWTETGEIFTMRKGYLDAVEIKAILREHKLEMVVADIGQKLKWINPEVQFTFWKSELKPHLCSDAGKIDIQNFPGEYAYLASEWVGRTGLLLILIEKYH